MIKRSELLNKLESELLKPTYTTNECAKSILNFIELYMQPKLRPLTKQEIEDHPLVKQVHDSRKDEVRNYVANLDYERKREFLPED